MIADAIIPFQQNLRALLDSVEDCLSKRRIIPCLILLYSGMDTISMLESGRASRSTFKHWVSKYVLKPGSGLNCTASDLYAARCGILHSLSAESHHSKDGHARRIIYAWGNAKAESLTRALRIMNRNDCAIHVRELIDRFRSGLADYVEDVSKDETRLKKLLDSTSLWFAHVDADKIQTFLMLHDSAR